jgi:hypothetical protein
MAEHEGYVPNPGDGGPWIMNLCERCGCVVWDMVLHDERCVMIGFVGGH